MKLIDQFENFIDEQKIDREGVYIEKTQDYDLASFGEMSEEGIPYNIMLIFYPDNDSVEVHIRKDIDLSDKTKVLEKTNDLTANYFGTCFFIRENLLVLKLPLFASGNINEVLKAITNSLKVANLEFPNFK